MKRPLALTCVIAFRALAGALAGAADAAGEADAAGTAVAAAASALVAPSPARRPLIGEWLEYRICYPVDPLENALSGNPVAPAAEALAAAAAAAAGVAAAAAQATAQAAEAADPDAAEDDAEAGTEPEYVYLPPSSEPATAWIELPLRLEVVQVADAGCRAVMSFGNLRREVELPNRELGAVAAAEFAYDSPPPADSASPLQLDGETFTCRLTRRDGEGYGFARLWSRDLPFGLARFATTDVDIILVGKGTGLPPDFPLRLKEEITPAPGLFYRPANPAPQS